MLVKLQERYRYRVTLLRYLLKETRKDVVNRLVRLIVLEIHNKDADPVLVLFAPLLTLMVDDN